MVLRGRCQAERLAAREGVPARCRGGPMPARKLREFLDHQGIPYTTISHAVAYTAKEAAVLTHISTKELAKTVIVKICASAPCSGSRSLSSRSHYRN